jgi:RNA polymerase sigma-70 factor (ECF subfamily)
MAERDHAHDVPGAAPVEGLFNRHYAAVSSYVRRRAPAETVDDVVAETFVVAWRRWERVPVDDALPWLLAVARNVIATQRRGIQRREALAARLRRTAEAQMPEPAGIEELDGSIAAALAELGEKDREALTLIAWDGLTPREAAVVLGELPTTFRARLHRAKRRLRRLLDAREQPTDSPVPRLLEAKESTR